MAVPPQSFSPILQPVVVLVAWTLVMLVWTLATRFPAMAKAGVRLSTLVGTKGADADRALPAQAQWKAHNYNHLVEQPTLFYAICAVHALAGSGTGVNAALAWLYVVLRIAHSLWQATVNRVSVRFYLFFASSLVLGALTLSALLVVF